MPEKVTLDTSVAVKWFYVRREAYVNQARKLLLDVTTQKIEVVVPDIFLYELGNVFGRARRLTRSEVDNNFSYLAKLPLEIVPVNYELIKEITADTFKYDLSFYDASYLTVGRLFSTLLFTEDDDLLGAKLPFIRPLADYGKK